LDHCDHPYEHAVRVLEVRHNTPDGLSRLLERLPRLLTRGHFHERGCHGVQRRLCLLDFRSRRSEERHLVRNVFSLACQGVEALLDPVCETREPLNCRLKP
jgi:hypothetical protein